ncbi:MAG TPA: hypothetical protein VKV73_29495 [Chloroflexota bacterium]|nr:hypothetical protein [Chloroflexota bacterium]
MNGTRAQQRAEFEHLILGQACAPKPSQQLSCCHRLSVAKQDAHRISWHAWTAGEQL